MIQAIIIDDEPGNIEVLKKMITGFCEDIGISGTAASVEEGIILIKERKPDLVFLDIEMPGRDGFTVCQKLREDADLKNIPVVILTSTSDPKLNEKAFKAGADITAMKSLSAERLVNMIRLALHKGKSAAGV